MYLKSWNRTIANSLSYSHHILIIFRKKFSAEFECQFHKKRTILRYPPNLHFKCFASSCLFQKFLHIHLLGVKFYESTINSVIVMSGDKKTTINGSPSQYVKLNVGGSLHYTTIGTLTKHDTMLRAMFSGRMEVLTDSEGTNFPQLYLRLSDYQKR